MIKVNSNETGPLCLLTGHAAESTVSLPCFLAKKASCVLNHEETSAKPKLKYYYWLVLLTSVEGIKGKG